MPEASPKTGPRLIVFVANAGGTGFEPATPSLGGSCPVLARLPAPHIILS